MKTSTAWLALLRRRNLPAWAGPGRRSAAPGDNRGQSENHQLSRRMDRRLQRLHERDRQPDLIRRPPEEGASLVYNDEKTLADSVTQTWQLTPNDCGDSISCTSSNTPAQLAQKILADVTR